MAKILFLQNLPFEYMGPMYISACLKQHGHHCRLFILSEQKKYRQKIEDYDPDLIAFSTMTGLHRWVLKTAEKIKNKINKPIILGGPHPTFFPEIILEPSVDMVCLGEGESTAVELANRLDNGDEFYDIRNLWIKKDGRIIKNDLRPLSENLDDLPFPDRSLYDDCNLLRSVPAMKFLTGRGCPYRCSFCFNHKFNQLYRGLGRIIRKRGVASLITEIKEMTQKYSLKLIRFPDDTFTGNRSWLLRFLEKFRQEIHLPFTGLARANELDEEVIRALKAAGCLNIYFGVETGNEHLRNRILKKNLTNRQITNAARLLKKQGLKFGTYNMFGLPHETLSLAFETIRFNRELQPDFTINNIFQPYPKTEISDYAASRGMLRPNAEYFETMNEGSILQLKEIKQIINLCRFAYLSIRFPILIPLIKALIKQPPNRLFKIIYDLSNAPAMKSNLNLSWVNLLKWGIKLRGIT